MAYLSIDSKSMAMKNGQSDFRVDSLAAFDAEYLRDFEELHPRVHHHLLHPGGGDLRLQFVENDMVNHEGKANRRFQRARASANPLPGKRIQGTAVSSPPPNLTFQQLGPFILAKIRDKIFNGGLL